MNYKRFSLVCNWLVRWLTEIFMPINMPKAPKRTHFTRGWSLGRHGISHQLWHPKIQGTALFCDIKVMQRSASLSKNLSPAPYSRETYTFCPKQALSFKVFRTQEGSAVGDHGFLARTLDEVARNTNGATFSLSLTPISSQSRGWATTNGTEGLIYP